MGAAPTDDRLFRAVFEGTLDALLLTDDEGTYVDVNEAATEMFGLSREELVGRSIAEFAATDLDLEAEWETFLEGGEMREEFEIQRPDGEIRVAEFAASANVLPGIHLSALRDVTEGTRNRTDLVRQTETFSKVFETSPVGILVVDADGEILDADRQAEQVLGLEEGGIVERSIDDLRWVAGDRDDGPVGGDGVPIGRVLETGEAVFDVEPGLERFDGETAWLSVNAVPIYEEDDDVSRVVALVSDITDRREYRRLLERQNERLEEYSATVSHDLRSPLSVASGWLDVAMDEESTAYLGKVEEALDRMDRLITDLRELGRYGQTVEEVVEIDLEDVVTDAWSNVVTEGAELEIEPDLGRIDAERGRLLRMFENLFRNSVEHGSTSNRTRAADAVDRGSTASSPGDSLVTVRVGPLERGFYVEDDGPGIDGSERENVFEFGYSTTEDGTGLGLAIVDAIADAHGWELELVDADPQGARFEFRRRWHPDAFGR